MKKKMFGAVALSLVLMANSSMALAAETKEQVLDLTIYESVEKSSVDKDGISTTVKEHYNKNGELIGGEVEKGTLATSSSKNSIQAAPYWSATSDTSRKYEGGIQVKVYGNGHSKSYTSSSKSSFSSINKIGVNTTLYFGNQVENSASKTNKNASTASASAPNQGVVFPDKKWSVISNHTFEHAGYNSWYPTTKYTEGIFG